MDRRTLANLRRRMETFEAIPLEPIKLPPPEPLLPPRPAPPAGGLAG